MDLFTGENLLALLTLTSLEVVLGIDNIVFISILTGKLPPEKQRNATRLGLALAMLMRIALLFAITWVLTLKQQAFAIGSHGFSGKDLILLAGGLFLIGKSVHEIHNKIGRHETDDVRKAATARFASVIFQIVSLDIVFSLDSVITAVGMVPPDRIWVMITAVVIAVMVMLAFSGYISRFIDKNPSLKVLALSFLLLIGVALTVDGFSAGIGKGDQPAAVEPQTKQPAAEEYHGGIDKKYIYFAMGFALFVEILNIRADKVREEAEKHAKKKKHG
ncbi:MAG: TerC family protein [Planctomycetia bacterium]|nr:TerC family protein [Planctomycetia bacterium]